MSVDKENLNLNAEYISGRTFIPQHVYMSIKNIILDAVFPHKCVCGKWGVLLCEECRVRIRVDKTGLCPICKKISEYGRTCSVCRHRSALTGVMILGPHKGVLRDLIWKYKYKFITDTATVLSQFVCNRFGDFLCEKRFLVTYSPSSKDRFNWRGFNQAQLLAEEISKELKLECKNLLYKENNVISQVGHTRRERLKNIKGKIKYIGSEEITNLKVIIIDDVYTTGATLEECAKVLRQVGYREVWGLVLSRD